MNTAPSIKSASVTLRYTTSTGNSSEVDFKSGQQPKPATAIQALAHAAEEIARIAEIAGEGQVVSDAVADAVKRVKEWRSEELAKQRRGAA